MIGPVPRDPRPRFTAAALTFAMLCAFLPVRAGAFSAPFPDMERSWFRYADAAVLLRDRGVLQGDPDGNFRPNDPVNRAEFLKIVFRARGGHEPVGGSCFPDVQEDAWYAPYVCAAVRRGIVKGYPDGTFKPDQPVNAAEAMKIILLAYGRDIEERGGAKWYEPYASALARDDVFPRNSYLPWQNLTRERTADLIVRVVRHEEDGVVPNLSEGCGKAARSVPDSVTVNGVERPFLLDTPRRYVSHDPFPLIVAFHGRTNSNEKVRSYYGLDSEAEGYFVAYPAGMQTDESRYSWSDPGDKIGTLRDVALFDAMVEKIADTYCVDLDRIYVVGHSLGAWMANSVACARGGAVRASATVGGDSMIAPCAGPSAAFLMHNPNDTLASFHSTERARDLRLETNACEAESAKTKPAAFGCMKYAGCDGGNDVVWCPHEINEDRFGAFYPHQWPEGTAEAIMSFFESL